MATHIPHICRYKLAKRCSYFEYLSYFIFILVHQSMLRSDLIMGLVATKDGWDEFQGSWRRNPMELGSNLLRKGLLLAGTVF